jgi:hypothetical protein
MGNAIISPEIKQYNRLHKAPHLAAFPCDHTVVISLHGKYFYKTQKVVSYDWQYKGQMLGMDTLALFICGFWPRCCDRCHAVIQCEIKFIASFPFGFGKGLG